MYDVFADQGGRTPENPELGIKSPIAEAIYGLFGMNLQIHKFVSEVSMYPSIGPRKATLTGPIRPTRIFFGDKNG